MAQHDYDLANASGANFRTDANNALSAIVSLNSGGTAPGTTFSYMLWADTTAGLLKIRNAANSAWITVGTLASTNLGLLALTGGTLTGALIANGAFIFNEAGADVDARFETQGQTHAIFLDAALNALGFRKSVPDANHIHVGAMGTLRDIKTLTDGATITPDMDTGDLFTVTLAGNRTLANPSNLIAGQGGSIFIVQDATGSRTLAYGTNWDFKGGTAPTLTTAANAVDRLDYLVRSTTSIHAIMTLDVK